MNSEKFWDKAANKYDQEEKEDEQTYSQIIEKTRKYLKISDVVLDYGNPEQDKTKRKTLFMPVILLSLFWSRLVRVRRKI